MRRDEWFAGQPLRVREPFEERNTARRIHAVGEGSLAVPGGDVSLVDDVTAASACLPPPLLPAHFWPYRPSRLLSRLTNL
jgi:hypothetical protein